MKIIRNAEIPINKIISRTLEEITRNHPDCIRDFEDTDKLVYACLFSKFPERRDYALRKLNSLWKTPVNVYTMEDDEVTYAYITFNNLEHYIFVSRYVPPLIEKLPDEEEMELWEGTESPH